MFVSCIYVRNKTDKTNCSSRELLFIAGITKIRFAVSMASETLILFEYSLCICV
jgi:hypothetical protein